MAPAAVSNPPFNPSVIPLAANVSLELLPVAAGSFKMGSPKTEEGRYSNETQHLVIISKPFWLGKTEVTQAQWQAVMGNNPSRFKDNGANHPVENVSWTDAVAFCKKLTERERAAGRLPSGYEYALPTEAEWEYACRAGSTGTYAGTGKLKDMGCYADNSGSATHKVATMQPNAWGLYDMHGNVWEWCSDWYGSYPSSSATDPTGPASGSCRVLRGGSWFVSSGYCRSAYRSNLAPGCRYGHSLGFRLALKAVR
jgi:formylglycine-generating enzyme required for sulfatase activity